MKNHTKKLGFTLIEIMVAVSIFAVVAVVATGALITASDINRKAQAIKLAVDNVNFALNKMAFEIRVGGVYSCGNSIPIFYDDDQDDDIRGCDKNSVYDTLFLYTYRDDCTTFSQAAGIDCVNDTENKSPVAYTLNTNNGKGEILYSSNPNVANSYYPITSSDVNITKLEFRVISNEIQPRVRVNLAGVVLEGTKYETIFELQTTGVSRGN